MITYVPERSLNGAKPIRVPDTSLANQISRNCIPLIALGAEIRHFSDAITKPGIDMTNPTGGGSTIHDGGESVGDGPFEDDELK